MNMQIIFILQRVTETSSAAKAAGWRQKKSHNQTNAVHIFFLLWISLQAAEESWNC